MNHSKQIFLACFSSVCLFHDIGILQYPGTYTKDRGWSLTLVHPGVPILAM